MEAGHTWLRSSSTFFASTASTLAAIRAYAATMSAISLGTFRVVVEVVVVEVVVVVTVVGGVGVVVAGHDAHMTGQLFCTLSPMTMSAHMPSYLVRQSAGSPLPLHTAVVVVVIEVVVLVVLVVVCVVVDVVDVVDVVEGAAGCGPAGGASSSVCTRVSTRSSRPFSASYLPPRPCECTQQARAYTRKMLYSV